MPVVFPSISALISIAIRMRFSILLLEKGGIKGEVDEFCNFPLKFFLIKWQRGLSNFFRIKLHILKSFDCSQDVLDCLIFKQNPIFRVLDKLCRAAAI